MKGMEMRVRTKKKIEMNSYTDIKITSDTNGAIVFSWSMDNGVCCNKELQPRDAVEVWRRMMGETDKDLHIFSPRLDVKYNDEEESWTFSDDEVLCVLYLDECMLVAWAIEKAGGNALYNYPVHPVQDKDLKSEDKTSDVWVLSCRRLLTGDTSCEGAELIGGSERVYATKESAMLDVHDILWEFVKDSHPEGYFRPDGYDLGETVEGIMNEASNNHQGRWLYDGSTQSFEVSLSCIPVRP